jgi:hypothetical protein
MSNFIRRNIDNNVREIEDFLEGFEDSRLKPYLTWHEVEEIGVKRQTCIRLLKSLPACSSEKVTEIEADVCAALRFEMSVRRTA